MRRFVASVVGIGALWFGSIVTPNAPAFGDPILERALVNFATPVRILDVTLLGKYVFEHDQSRMARGEPCTFIYKQEHGGLGEPVVVFHCIPRERGTAVAMRLVLERDPTIAPIRHLVEYQFKGSAEGHGVPTLPAR